MCFPCTGASTGGNDDSNPEKEDDPDGKHW